MKRQDSIHNIQYSGNKFKVSSKQSPLLSEQVIKQKTRNINIKTQTKYEDQDTSTFNIFQVQAWNSDQFSNTPFLKSTINNQQNEIFTLKQKLLFQQNLVKITSVKELQTQIQNYFDETTELKRKLNEALNSQYEPQRQQNQGHISKIKEQKQEIESLQKEIQKLQQQVKQLSEQLSQNCNQWEQLQMAKQHQRENSTLIQNRIVIKEIQSEGENVDKYVQAIKEKDSKIQELQANLANQNAQINQQRQQMKQQDLLISEKQDIIENLQQEVKNLETKLLNVQNSQKQKKKKQEDKEIKAILRFRLKRSMVEQKEILNYLLTNEDCRFFSIQSRFQKFPFFLNAEESYDITMFLLTEESPYNYKVLEKDLKFTVLKSRILHLLPQYQLLTIDEQGQLFQYISTKIINKLNYLQDTIKKIKISQKSDQEDGFCLPQQFLEAFTCILDKPLSKKEAEYLFQLNFEISNSPILINFKRLIYLFQKEPKYGINRICNLSDSFFKEEELIKIPRPSLIRNQSVVLYVSPKQINTYTHKFQQTDETELGKHKQQKALEFHRFIGVNITPTSNKVEVGVCCQKSFVIVQQNELSYNKKVKVDQENLEKVKNEQYLQQQLQKEKQIEKLQKAKSNNNQEIKNIVSLYLDQLLQDFVNLSKQD
ncbi:unnamed protein product [Paramecium octaurelia]|uniref:Uncharacterized protein n=1 Tax=Paramecium octaurelia TaxID=43137 RepID=A0A8S1WK19_PAROT|nr:unnamed protein product [Paramecium octaurelia]